MSNKGTKYLIDTSVFIQAYRAYYSFQLCPGFWECVGSLHTKGLIASIDKVFDEICFGDEDELTVWSKKAVPKEFFESSDNDRIIECYAKIQNWANSQPQFSRAAKAAFADEADAWLVAHAVAGGFTVVTQEVFAPDIQRKIPIPNICRAPDFTVNCVDVFAMLNRLGVQFVAR